MAKDPAFLFYSSDFLNGVSDLTFEERGQFITMMCLQHQKGELTEKTIRLSIGSVSVDVISKFTKLKNGNFVNIRLNEEIEKRKLFTESRINNGKKGGRPKKPLGYPKNNLMEDENENENESIIDNKNEIKSEIFEKEFTDLLAEYFLQTTEVQKMRITGFLMSKEIKPQIENFKEQTIAYANYKKITGEKIHNWNSYQSEWDREDWIKKLKREKTNGKQTNNNTGADQEFRDKTAKRLGLIKP